MKLENGLELAVFQRMNQHLSTEHKHKWFLFEIKPLSDQPVYKQLPFGLSV